MNPATITSLDLALAAPEIFLLTATCVILLVDLFLEDGQRVVTFVLSLLALAGTAYVTARTGVDARTVAWHGTYVADPVGNLLKVVAYGAVAVVFLYSFGYLQVRRLLKGEFFVLGLFALLGIMVLISANSLVTLYLGVELLALSLYALVAFNRDSAVSAEAAIMYFVLGSIASGALLYGMSMIYGVTGSLQLGAVSDAVAQAGPTQIGLLFGLAFIIVGVAFKFGAVPFHMWVPDVYHGAPTAVTLFLSSAPKLASFALAFRLLAEGLGGLHDSWQDMLALVAVLSMAIGNVVAIAQTNLKRMLAYSAVSHIGFLFLGFAGGGAEGYAASMFYVISYALMSAAAFGAIVVLSGQGFEADTLDDFKGLNARSPWLAGLVLCIMASLAGVPPFLGFWAKLAVLRAALQGDMLWLAIVGIVFAVIGAFYYLRVVKVMYFDEPVGELAPRNDRPLQIAFGVNALSLLVLGIFWNPLMSWCQQAFTG
jgi:NADH-quinone oxidoreductase subunit N